MSQMQAHQTIGIVEGDFSDRGAARVRQVGVTVVDGQSAETCEKEEEKRIESTLIHCCNWYSGSKY